MDKIKSFPVIRFAPILSHCMDALSWIDLFYRVSWSLEINQEQWKTYPGLIASFYWTVLEKSHNSECLIREASIINVVYCSLNQQKLNNQSAPGPPSWKPENRKKSLN